MSIDPIKNNTALKIFNAYKEYMHLNRVFYQVMTENWY